MEFSFATSEEFEDEVVFGRVEDEIVANTFVGDVSLIDFSPFEAPLMSVFCESPPLFDSDFSFSLLVELSIVDLGDRDDSFFSSFGFALVVKLTAAVEVGVLLLLFASEAVVAFCTTNGSFFPERIVEDGTGLGDFVVTVLRRGSFDEIG